MVIGPKNDLGVIKFFAKLQTKKINSEFTFNIIFYKNIGIDI